MALPEAWPQTSATAAGLNLGEGGGKGTNGNGLIGKAYPALLDRLRGDALEIKLGRQPIRLLPTGCTDNDD